MSSTNYAKYSGLGGSGGGAGSGTVTSVALTAPSAILSVSGSPITTSGTLALTLATQTANFVWAGPTTGVPATPTFRALVAADLPFALTNLTDVGTDGIVITNGTGAVVGASPVTIAQHVADTTHNGYLLSTDWNTFNGKQAAGNYITALTGDVTATGPGSVAATIAALAVTNAKIANATIDLTTKVTSTLPIANGGTNKTSVTTAPTATAWAGWDANKNLSSNNLLEAYTTTVSSATPIVLTVGSTFLQYVTGSTAQTVTAPVASTLVLGMQYQIVNLSSNTTTVQSSGANTIQAMAANTVLTMTCILASGTTAASWSAVYSPISAGAGTVTAVSVASANGFAGSSSGGATPALTISTTITGILQGNGTAISAATTTGSGSVALATSPVLVTPALGTPASGVLTNVTGLPLTTGVTGVLPAANGGTAQSAYAAGDILYASAINTLSRLAKVTDGNVLTLVSGLPAWVAPGAGTFTAPTGQKFTSTGTTTGWVFTISTSTTCAAGDTYTNNSVTYTVLAALTAQTGQVLFCSGAGAPLASGTLTRASGAGTASVTFTLATALATYTRPTGPTPLYLRVRMVGGGGGGGGSGTSGSGGTGGTGGSTFFGALLLSCVGGTGGNSLQAGAAANGGTASLGTGPIGVAQTGNSGGTNALGIAAGGPILPGGGGGASPFGGAAPGSNGGAGLASAANSGSGGSGGNIGVNSVNEGGCGGGSGGYIDAMIPSPATTYFYCVGAGGSAGTAGTSGAAGGAGGSAQIIIEEMYQ